MTQSLATPTSQRKKAIYGAMIALLIVGGLLAFVVPIGFLAWMDDQTKLQEKSEKDQLKRAAAVFTIEKLPPDYHFGAPTFSISRSNTGAALLQNSADDTSVYFEKKAASKLDAVKKRMENMSGFGDHFTVKENGSLPVAGKSLVYVRGLSQRASGEVFNELRGYVLVNDNTLVEVATGTPEGRPIDMEAIKSLLASIQSFTP